VLSPTEHRGSLWNRDEQLAARGSIQEEPSNLKFPPTYHSNFSAEANFNRDLLLFPLEGMAFD